MRRAEAEDQYGNPDEDKEKERQRSVKTEKRLETPARRERRRRCATRESTSCGRKAW